MTYSKDLLRSPLVITTVLVTLCFGLLLLGSLSQQKVKAQGANERVISVFDNGSEQTFVTDEKNVGDALREAGIHVEAADAVEPTENTELVASNYNINIYRARPVLVVDGQKRKTVVSPHKSARQVVEKAGYTIYPEDEADIERVDDPVSEGAAAQKVVIDRATPFTLVLYGQKTDARTQAGTVGEVLGEKDIKLAANDITSLPLNTPVTAGMTLEVWRNGVQTITQEQDVAFSIRRIEDKDRPIGYKEIQTAGVVGKKVVTYEVNMQNGKVLSKKEIQSVVTKQPKEQVEIVGAKGGFSGDFGAALARLRSCEGSYSSNTGNGYYGAYQFDIGTWGGYQGYPHAAAAPPAVQDQKAWETYKRRGWSPWPSCSRSMGLQDIYR